MGEFKTVSIKELKKDNPRLCLSALRVFNKCFDCPQYDKCESKKINKEYEQKYKTIKKLKEEIKQKEQEIKNL